MSTRERAGLLWGWRAGVEIGAARRFERLAASLAEHDADPHVVTMARNAAEDEHRHATLCRELAQHFGSPSAPAMSEDPPAVTLGRTAPRERLVAELVAMSCITESLSAAVLIEMRRAAVDPAVRDTVHEVLIDEIDHARLGWAHLTAERGRTCVSWIGPHLPRMLAATVPAELFDPSQPGPGEEALAGLGGLPLQVRRDLFVGALQGVVFPGLMRFGIDPEPGRAWLRRMMGHDRTHEAAVREVNQRLQLAR